MILQKNLKRRIVLRRVTASALVFLGSTIFPKIIHAGLLATPTQAEGPFYPIDKPIDQDGDLTLVANQAKRAQGDVCIITGQISRGGLPVPGVRVEIWQANKWGRYQDKRDNSNLPLDHNFQGFGVSVSDKNGHYIFKTIRPAGYSFGGIYRTPHIHFKVKEVGADNFVTQMYFAGDSGNNRDVFLNNIARKESVVVKFRPLANGHQIGVFDIVLG